MAFGQFTVTNWCIFTGGGDLNRDVIRPTGSFEKVDL